MLPLKRHNRTISEAGFSLIEVMIVILVLGILVSLFIPRNNEALESARFNATMNEMEELARAIRGNSDRYTSAGEATSFGYVGDVGALPSSLQDLVSNPGGYATWRGPYVQTIDDDYASDSWGSAYSLSGVNIVSNGSGSTITKQFANNQSELVANSVSGQITDAAKLPPGSTYSDSVQLRLILPDGSGGSAVSTTTPSSTGLFSFNNVPIGRHKLQIIFTPSSDTLTDYVTVLPGSTPALSIQFPISLW